MKKDPFMQEYEKISSSDNEVKKNEDDKVFEYGVENAFEDTNEKDIDNSTKSKSYSTNSYKDLTIKDWVITLLITGIPLVGFVMLFVWGFSDNPHPVRSKWAKATLIVFLIGLGLWFLIMILAALSMSNRGYY